MYQTEALCDDYIKQKYQIIHNKHQQFIHSSHFRHGKFFPASFNIPNLSDPRRLPTAITQLSFKINHAINSWSITYQRFQNFGPLKLQFIKKVTNRNPQTGHPQKLMFKEDSRFIIADSYGKATLKTLQIKPNVIIDNIYGILSTRFLMDRQKLFH